MDVTVPQDSSCFEGSKHRPYTQRWSIWKTHRTLAMARTAGLLILLGILCLPRELSFLFTGRGRPLHIGRPHWVLRAKGEQSEELVIGMNCSATVTNLKKVGADLDLPGKKPGWIHISQLQEGYTEKVEDVLSVGRQIEVRVMKVKEDQVEVSELRRKQTYIISYNVGS